MPRLWSACFTLGCSIGWLSVTVVTLVRVFSCSRYVGGSLFPVPGLWAGVIAGRYAGRYA